MGSKVPIELQPVSIGISHVKLTRAPSGVAHLSPVERGFSGSELRGKLVHLIESLFVPSLAGLAGALSRSAVQLCRSRCRLQRVVSRPFASDRPWQHRARP